MKNKYINTVVSLFIGILLGITGTLAITNQQQNNEIIVAQKEITEEHCNCCIGYVCSHCNCKYHSAYIRQK